MQKNEVGFLPQTAYNNLLKMDHRLKPKSSTVRLLEENTGVNLCGLRLIMTLKAQISEE